jgi:hypothetical protein
MHLIYRRHRQEITGYLTIEAHALPMPSYRLFNESKKLPRAPGKRVRLIFYRHHLFHILRAHGRHQQGG